MFEDRFLEITQEELERLTQENTELKRKLLLYEQLFEDIKEILERREY